MTITKFYIRKCVYLVVLFTALPEISNLKAANMAITNLFPANNAAEVCADTKLWITFATAPIVTTDGNMVIYKASDDSVVYQLSLQTLPSDSYGHIATGWPYQINLNGLTVNYEPVAVSGNTLEIYPSTRLAYNTEYYVKISGGFCTDANGNTSPDINDNTMWRFTTKPSAPAADHDYTVALDGSGDFCTIQGAVDAVTNNDSTRTIIKIKNGTYREIVNIPSGKINMTWLGEDTDTTIIAGYNRELFNSGTANRVMVKNYGNDFRMYNMTFHNTAPDNSGQAETLRNNALRCFAQNCKYKSYQDTLLVNAGQSYFNKCYIEGDTDYIWGGGTAYFDNCEMHCLSTQSYITQPRAAAPPATGIFIVDCNLTAAPGVTGCYLGRTTNDSYPYCQSVFLNCRMPNTLIAPAGWKIATGTTVTNLRWWEYRSVDTSGNPLYVNGRVPYSKQLDDANALYWRDVNNVFAQSPWNPKNLGENPTFAWEPYPSDGQIDIPVEGTTLTWAAGAATTSHIIYFGTTNPPDFAAEQTARSYTTGTLVPGTTYYWRIDEKNSTGTTTGTVWSFTAFAYVCTSAIVSDLNANCQVDLTDYASMADEWGGNLPDVDLNGDGRLDFMDIAQFSADWLSCNREPAGECWQ